MSVIRELLDGVLEIQPAASALEFESRWFSWDDLHKAIDSLAAELRAAGVAPGSRVGVFGRNRPAAVAAVLAVAREGCIVTVNPMLPPGRLVEDVAGLDLPALIGEAGDFHVEGLEGALQAAGTVAIVLAADLSAAHRLPGLETVRTDKPAPPPSDMIIEMLTSGTTGPPKRIPLQRKAFEASFASAGSYEKGRKAQDAPRLRSGVEVVSGSITHIGGLWGLLSATLNGRRTCLLERFTVDGWRDALVRHRPKIVGAVPAGLRMVLDADLPREDFSSLMAIRTGSAPLDPAITEAFLERYGVPVLQTYGATELSGAVAGWTLDAFNRHYRDKVDSVGRFQPGVAGRVVDADTGEAKAAGEEGILEMTSPQFGIGEAWLRTTDRAVIDGDGFLFIKGRADNAIIRGGFKVHPDDVARVLQQHPAVREAVVVGVKDARLGETPMAAIMLRAEAVPPSSGELADFARARLLAYQVPSRFLIVDDVPRTSSMKPALVDVRQLFSEAAA